MPRRAPASLPYANWPPGDRIAWESALRDGGLFDQRGAAAHWSERTRDSIRYDYGIWLLWCQGQGRLSEIDLGDRVTASAVEDYLSSMKDSIAPVTRHIRIQRLHQLMVIFSPEEDWAWLRETVNRLGRLAKPSRNKTQRIQDGSALVDLGHQLMREAAEAFDPGLPPRERLETAVQYRDGLIIGFLAMRPLRRSNLAAIRLGTQLRRNGSGWHLCFASDETKSGRPIEQPFPHSLVPFLETYLALYRPVFPGASEHEYLWASAKNCPLTHEGCYQRIIKRTKAAFGHPVNPHLFRDCAATTIARHSPEHIGTASQLLGHARLDTTERHYNQAGSVSAGRDYHATLAQLRADSPRGRSR